jgi:hypothetical protein
LLRAVIAISAQQAKLNFALWAFDKGRSRIFLGSYPTSTARSHAPADEGVLFKESLLKKIKHPLVRLEYCSDFILWKLAPACGLRTDQQIHLVFTYVDLHRLLDTLLMEGMPTVEHVGGIQAELFIADWAHLSLCLDEYDVGIHMHSLFTVTEKAKAV